MHLFLIGPRGSGKTHVARLLAAHLGLPWHDTDELIRQRQGQTIEVIFRELGEDRFRERERAVIRDLAGQPASVISLGGGAVLSGEVRDLLKSSGRCVWLRALPTTLARRLRRDPLAAQRPTLTDLPLEQEIELILQQRWALYEACADYTIDTDELTAEQVAEAIGVWWQTADNEAQTPPSRPPGAP